MVAVPDAESLLADRYRLKQLVGSGASGQVWRAVDERLRREVAVKTVDLARHHGDPGIVARFQREVRTSAALHSPHVAAIYDSGQDEQIAFMVMELLSGPSLAALIAAEGPLDWDRGLALATNVAVGLADAHAEGVIHRDLKPGNVVLHDGLAKIVDFGIARATESGERTLTSPSTITGTAAYMSPEQASGQEVTPATDLYSLGCVLFALFTGQPPFAGPSALATAGAHVHEAAPRLRDRRPDAPAPLDTLVAHLLAKVPEQRPDARTTARALGRLRAELRKPTGAAQPDELTGPMAAITAPIPPVRAPLPPAAAPPSADDDVHRTAVMPAIEVAAAAASGRRTEQPSPTPPARPTPRETRAARRRPGMALRWLVTILLALALAAVAWVGLGQPTPWAPATPSASPTRTTPSRTAAPTVTLPIVVPTQPTTPPPTTPTTSAAPSPSATPTPTAPAASTPTAQPSG